MNIRRDWRRGSMAIAGALILAGCASTPQSNAELERARAAVTRVEAMPDSKSSRVVAGILMGYSFSNRRPAKAGVEMLSASAFSCSNPLFHLPGAGQ